MKTKNKHLIRITSTVFVASLFIAGCASTPEKESVDANVPLSGTDEQIFVGDTIEMNYDPNVIMKRAESYHEKKGYAEAVVEYQHFLDLHRNHVLAPYAWYRLALSHFKMIQTIDRDISPVEKALYGFTKLMEIHPGSQYEAEARTKIRECEDFLAQHHLFVAKFYYRKEAYLAAARRYKLVIDSYPHLEIAAEAKYKLAKTYKDLGATDWSRDWLVALVREHPQHNLRNDGLKMLAKLQEENPGLAVAQNLENAGGNLPETSTLPLERSRLVLSSSTIANSASPARLAPTSAQSTPSVSKCGLGTWCEASNSPEAATHASPTPVPITCQPGQWCE
jgi:outer membrane protein assembly factor BamD